MYKIFIYLILFSLISCQNSVNVNDIKNIDNIAYHNNKVFTGIAVDTDQNEKLEDFTKVVKLKVKKLLTKNL